MKKNVVLFLFVITWNLCSSQSYKVMLITGGHSYDTIQFFQMFDALDNIEYEHFEQPEANQQLVVNLAKDFDVVVFYDMWQKISAEEKATYIKLTKLGKPFLFLHHSIVSYQNWTKFEQIVGGKYFENKKGVPEELVSSYDHDVWVYCDVVNYTPVTSGLHDIRFFDEVYGNLRISEDVKPLLKTKHPKSSEYVAWEHHYNASNIIYLQPGHDKRTYQTDAYRKLLTQAIKYLAKQN